ncbi:TPA: structural protein [Enterococcus faecalis]|uniref:structural protein n=1 Tax=Enterococcus faecalis TaxID=1351 RepID=UPI0006663886|nr:structural protein [Enterococcus faecalis]HAP4195997.1 structural protein [Enterococcus faecalis]HAP4242205.1 structural protein [Enterococcus faecalis]HAP4298496.1 structural protein [Enterococcus faecalis]
MEWSFPWLSIDGDRMYDDSDFSKFFEGLFSYGVSLTTANALKVTASPNGGMKVQVDSGYAFVGKVFLNSTTKALSIDVASSMQDRTDSIVVRVDKSVRDVFLAVKKNDTTVTRTSDVYELQLATIRVPRNVSSITGDLITDKRADTKVCGYSSPFQKVNVSGLEEQYGTILKKIAEANKTSYEKILNDFKNYVAKAQTDMDSNIEEIIQSGNGKVSAFDVLIHEWFAALKNELDTNQASNLQNQINEMKATEELPAIEHNLLGYPNVQVLYWEYGIGLSGLANEPTGLGGSNVKKIPHSVEYLDLFSFKVKVPMNFKMVNPTVTKIDSRTIRFIEAFKVIEIKF